MRHLKILIILGMIAFSGYSHAFCGVPPTEDVPCDADGNLTVDIDDISAITLARGTVAEDDDVRDIDDDGMITVLDARQCVAHCEDPGCVEPCSRGADETSRVETARALVTLNASNYLSRMDYWAQDIVYREAVWTHTGRSELLNYLTAVFSGSAYGFPDDRQVEIKNELYSSLPDGSLTYMATVEWTGSFGTEFFFQTGMSIIKFRPAEGCPYYQRDYYSEGDTWWNVPTEKADINTFRNIYIDQFGLTGRCFDDDEDGYTKYINATGCPETGLDCNDFDPEIYPGAPEMPGDGIDQDCDPLVD
jgi:hypothetical protein